MRKVIERLAALCFGTKDVEPEMLQLVVAPLHEFPKAIKQIEADEGCITDDLSATTIDAAWCKIKQRCGRVMQCWSQ